MPKGSDPNSELGEFSPITEYTRRFFQALHYLAPMGCLKYWFPILRPRSELLPEEVTSKDFTKKRGKAIEMYLFAWLVLEALLVIISCFIQPTNVWIKILICTIAILRVIEIIQVTVNATLFDALSGRQGHNDVASKARMLVLAAVNYGELCCCFGIIYALFYQLLQGAGQPVTGFYLSIITQLTIGYGDVNPTRWLRIIATIQGLIGTLFLVVVVARFVASMPRIKEVVKSE